MALPRRPRPLQPVQPPLPLQLPQALLRSKVAGRTEGPGLKDGQVALSPKAGSVCKFPRAPKPLSQARILQIFFTFSRAFEGWHDPLPGLAVAQMDDPVLPSRTSEPGDLTLLCFFEPHFLHV